MKKIILLLVATLSILSATNAQKIKVVSGDMKFMKDLAEISVLFEFPDDMKYGKMTQGAYVEQEKEKREAKKEGDGEAWEERFISDREDFKSKFMYSMEKYAGDLYVAEDDEDFKYTMIVKTTFTEPGYFVGFRSKGSAIDLEITYVETENMENVLAVMSVKKAPGAAAPDKNMRVADAYFTAAQGLGKYLKKKVL
ncbi:MAG: hypothetical protein KAH25_03800 [Bacteroidales bacterium]|nr:hypothetical protein [Bacteroidales bacterium]